MSGPLAPGPIPDDQRDSPPVGMSGTTKLLLILGGIAGLAVVACCGGGVFLSYKFQDMASSDPEKIRATAAEIVDMEIPPGFKPAQRMDMFGFMKLVIFTAEEKQPGKNQEASMLMLSAVSNPAGNDDQQQRATMRQQLEAQSRQGNNNLKVLKSTTREFKIRGGKSEFEFVEAEDQATRKKVRQVIGSFPAKSGTGMLILVVPEEQYDEQAAIRMIESIR